MNPLDRKSVIKIIALVVVNLALCPVVALFSSGLTHFAIEFIAETFQSYMQGDGWAGNWHYYFLALGLGGCASLLCFVGIISRFNWLHLNEWLATRT